MTGSFNKITRVLVRKSAAKTKRMALNQINKYKMKTKIFSYLILLIIVIGMDSCSSSNNMLPVSNNPGGGGGGGGAGGPGANAVWMQGMAFNPATRTVAAGTTVTWTNKAGVDHNVTSDDGTFTSSGTIGPGGTYSFTFTATGTYHYNCTFHAGMNGTIIVN
jgi:plastocyanin